MSRNIGKIIAQRTGYENLISILSEELSGADLNSLLLEVYARRAQQLAAPELLKQYDKNRFVQPAETDFIQLLESSVQTLKCLSGHDFVPLQVSPLSQLGASSVVATVDQDKVVSALRNCEVLSDATNALALYISSRKKAQKQQAADTHLKYCTVQRHVRAQQFNIKGFSPHFTIGCLVSSGMDTGNYDFEKKVIGEHFKALHDVLTSVFNTGTVKFRLQQQAGYPGNFIPVIMTYLQQHFPEWEVTQDETPGTNNYYKGLQFKVVISWQQRDFEIADGGLVDWTQQLLNNKKERFFISGFGLELLNKMEEGLL
jgi:RNA binding exosome subunit